MAVIFVSRHAGAIEWMKRQPVHVDRWVSHLQASEVNAGDTVIGVLPMHLAADICAKNARYLALEFNMPMAFRGQELTCEELGSVRISVSGEVIPGAAQRGCPLYLRCSMPDLMR